MEGFIFKKSGWLLILSAYMEGYLAVYIKKFCKEFLGSLREAS